MELNSSLLSIALRGHIENLLDNAEEWIDRKDIPYAEREMRKVDSILDLIYVLYRYNASQLSFSVSRRRNKLWSIVYSSSKNSEEDRCSEENN